MHLAYFADTPRIGGAERFLANLIAGAAAAGHDVTLFSPQDEVLELIGAEAPTIALVRLGPRDFHTLPTRPAKLAALLRSPPGILRAFSRAEADLLHVNNGGYPGSELCRLAIVLGRFARVPRRLLTVHSAPWPRGAPAMLQLALDRAVWSSADGVHATTDFVRERLTELRGMPPSLGMHIAYGVSEPGASGAGTLREGLAGTSLVVAMVSATADHEKGHATFVEAIARTTAPLHSVIVGPVPDTLPERIRELGLEDQVVLTGPVTSTAVGSYLHAADVLVVPSTAYESLPLVVLEAMAASRPVLASRLSGIPEAVIDGETGRLFSPGAVDELADLLGEAARNRAQLLLRGDAGRRRWTTCFSVEAMVEKMLALYEGLTQD